MWFDGAENLRAFSLTRRSRHKGGTILDPGDGKVYKAEIWIEDGKLKVRGYLGPFYKTQTWLKGN